MKSFALIVVLAQVAIFQTYGQCLRPALPNVIPAPLVPSPCGPTFLPSPVLAPQLLAGPQVISPTQLIASPQVLSPQVLVQPNSVANNLADTLSLLTVSSLLSESLPLGYPNVVSVPMAAPAVLGGCNFPYYF